VRVSGVGAAPLLPDEGPRGARIVRRVRGIAIEVVALVAVTLLLPLLLAVAVFVDLGLWVTRRKPWMATRLVLMLWWFLFGELRGMLGLLGIWILTGGPRGLGSERRRRWVYDLRIHWARSHLGGVRVLFGLDLEVEGLQHAGPGPVLLMMRHASIIDNALPDALIGRAHGMGLRFVLKQELQVLPTIDIGGRWVPTSFVARGSPDSGAEIARLRTLAHELGPGEGVMIYPEGSRATPTKIARAKQVIADRQPEIAPLAAGLRHVLPPRLGGPLALLDESAGTDVVVCAHVGLDGFAKVSDIWSGGLVGTTVRLRLWRFRAAEIPPDRSAQVVWLYERWQQVDDWIDAQGAGSPR
jgi:1-acyl-sn-glycerol-3-phosphate acyltransferase